MHVLIVEDEVRLADALGQIMSEQKYATDIVYNGEDGLNYALSGQYDVIVLDVMLPKRSGFEVVRELRKQKNATPVLLLTARDEITDKVTGLDCGADDYMTKPFAPEELLARIRAISRRQGDVVLEELTFADLRLNLSTYDLHQGEKSVHLGFKEFEVLKILMANPKMVVPKEDLLTKVWGVESHAEDNNVEAYISFLRKKFFFLGSKVSIGTIRKVGYRLAAEEL
ncbi:response regulator transcription factor [Desulfoscipio gibsoniae]|uniref:Stage 0 sporulation protein A homolog n=1 Tax=Desulfoscipio gibsoniae DSM 7213 TaxID=767817 RepID=R4KPR1_9FIRM|nr:response regulator transcription factor [Desulfoscipio gibsoniae]AGL03507.1 response regulator with CheY-like receiver domain and winged-helix DNA-binding domain [Desulfoscipio gibsoniae DSM 7213]